MIIVGSIFYHLPLISLPIGSPLFTLPITIFTLEWFLIFCHSNGLISIVIVYYDSYYAMNHPPKDFKVHIFPFDWALGVVTFQLLLEQVRSFWEATEYQRSKAGTSASLKDSNGQKGPSGAQRPKIVRLLAPQTTEFGELLGNL